MRCNAQKILALFIAALTAAAASGCVSTPCRYEISIEDRSGDHYTLITGDPVETHEITPLSRFEYTLKTGAPLEFTIQGPFEKYIYQLYDYDHWFPVTHRTKVVIDEKGKPAVKPDRLQVRQTP